MIYADSITKLLSRSGLLKGGRISERRVSSIKYSELVDVAVELSESSKDISPAGNSVFSHSASLHLSGGRYECGELNCRIGRAQKLCRLAALYSDRIYVYNFLSDFSPGKLGQEDCAASRQDFYNDLSVLFEILPLIKAGVVVPFTPKGHVCVGCLGCAEKSAVSSFGTRGKHLFRKTYKKLASEYLQLTKASLEKDDDEYIFSFAGPAPYFEHTSPSNGAGLVVQEIPPFLKKSSLMKSVYRGKEVVLPNNVCRKLGFHEGHARQVVWNANFSLLAAQALKTSFLTDNSLHARFLNSFNKSSDLDRRNRIAAKHLTSFVPFAEGVKTKDLLRLREREGAAFLEYRQALLEVIEIYRSKDGALSEQKAKQIYSEVIRPRLEKLNQRVKLAKKDLVQTTAMTVGLTGALCFGIYKLSPGPEWGNLVGALMGFGPLSQFMGKMWEQRNIENAARADSLYFLWKAKQLERRSR